MNISLKPEHEQFIQAQIQSGQYRSAEELLDAAIALLQQRAQRLEALRQQIAVGSEQIARGQVTDGELVFNNLQAKISRIAESEA